MLKHFLGSSVCLTSTANCVFQPWVPVCVVWRSSVWDCGRRHIGRASAGHRPRSRQECRDQVLHPVWWVCSSHICMLQPNPVYSCSRWTRVRSFVSRGHVIYSQCKLPWNCPGSNSSGRTFKELKWFCAKVASFILCNLPELSVTSNVRCRCSGEVWFGNMCGEKSTCKTKR